MFRHTHATNLLETGWDAALVQKRLGHRRIQTTLDNYSHVSQATLKAAYKNYLSKKGE
jgi:site-specific recombinase XerD